MICYVWYTILLFSGIHSLTLLPPPTPPPLDISPHTQDKVEIMRSSSLCANNNEKSFDAHPGANNEKYSVRDNKS